MAGKNIPVYLFLGLLESGKTKLIQETLEDPEFDDGSITLLLVCEEGEMEYEQRKFAKPDRVVIKTVNDKSEFNVANLTRWAAESKCGRVMIEYNGMWMVNELYNALPGNMLLFQSLLTVDSNTIFIYSKDNGMRSLLIDKLAQAEMVVFNRADVVNSEEKKMELHKLVRQASRKSTIVYEFNDGTVEYDEIPDPLPFDVNAPVIEIKDNDYGVWMLDCQNNISNYEGKTISFLAQVCQTKKPGPGFFVPGRFVMTCCAADIQFIGFPCRYEGYEKLKDKEWVRVTAVLNMASNPVYKNRGPVLTAKTIVSALKPQNEVVTFS